MMNQGDAKLDNVLPRHGKKTEEMMEACRQRPLGPCLFLSQRRVFWQEIIF